MKKDLLAENLATVEAHFHSEALNEVEKALELYTDDIVWESPVRNLVFRGKKATGENYRKMFASFQVEEFRCLQRFATEDRVVDDSLATVTLIGDTVENAPVPVGSRVEIRLLHIFEMRAGKISRELVFEKWKVIQPAVQELAFNVGSSMARPVKALSNGIILPPANGASLATVRR
jgi:ketosteroid isomerase-like protein